MGSVGFLIFWLLFIIVASYVSYQNREASKAAWKKLASSHNLCFIEGDLFSGAYVYGSYGGHALKLETYQKSQGKSSYTYTRVSLDVRSASITTPSEQLTVDSIKQLFQPAGLYTLKRTLKAGEHSRQLIYESRGVETDIHYLKKIFDCLVQVACAYRVVSLGGEAVPVLKDIATQKSHSLHFVAAQILYEISYETQRRLGSNSARLICPRCMARCGSHPIKLAWWRTLTYYGCRICGQSREFLTVDGPIVAVLDSAMSTDYAHQYGSLKVNWLAQRTLFDFDTVEILQASDEDVERFAVQVGNDTDETRAPRYKQMQAVIRCRLSENTYRILRQMFGQVEILQSEPLFDNYHNPV